MVTLFLCHFVSVSSIVHSNMKMLMKYSGKKYKKSTRLFMPCRFLYIYSKTVGVSRYIVPLVFQDLLTISNVNTFRRALYLTTIQRIILS